MILDPVPLAARRWAQLTEDDLAARLSALARGLQADPARADVLITLHGELGAGKTTLVRHLLRALGVSGRIKSPTFALVEPYELTLGGQTVPVWHADLYRLTRPSEWIEAGLAELFAGRGLRLVEWPERAGAALSRPDVAVHLDAADDDRRTLQWLAYSPQGRALLELGPDEPA
ncbi:tRNA threonylcarbamoyladenosine biosynthesis protein TsaE [Tepidimonas alkaliphilus]|uniref:tRNA threonylcarbamoyladenosine biosynthesis protein TsaE n=1 Tax=Tepidimonas alkaliphilus TaxID=2588942 RepID=A0A554WA52_9BURK|nr:tRNA (adenosine(37)-N6)-threonylcarbamoyltransferase complex ATPase subunit type 1 TsaE [Tepidimonas alkaliphilus]TSE20432.1 tRNA threonylcarbamoyladenosine biosynthesis protein TsaE [Tepidimonas alkaliphilus]